MAIDVGKKHCVSPTESLIPIMSQDIFPVLPNRIREIICTLPADVINQVEEIRLRQGKPLLLRLMNQDTMITPLGQTTDVPEFAYLVNDQDMMRTVQLISGSSVYAFEDEIRSGFITIRGGHRVGITGKTTTDKGRVKTIKYISGLNIRIAREIIGAADQVMPFLIDPVFKTFQHTLIISPPRCGKTTLIRDIIRQLSNGIIKLDFKGVTVGLVDERSEIAGSFKGLPQKEIGIRTDVLDGCPKAEGMMMMIRAMAPQVIATDEIGRQEESDALEEALNAGIKVLTSAHGASIEEIKERPVLRDILERGIFKRIIILSRSKGVGTIEKLIDMEKAYGMS